MKNILIAARTEIACKAYAEMLNNNMFRITEMSDAGAIRFLNLNAYSAALISLPLADENGVSLIEELHEHFDTPLGVLVKPDITDAQLDRLIAANAYILKKPVSRSNYRLAAGLLSSFSDNNADMKERIKALERKNNEIKLMSRAKLLLMQSKGMSEDDAHAYILHRAMNKQMSIDAVCKEIIKELKE